MKTFITIAAIVCTAITAQAKVVTDSIKSTILGATVKVNIYLPAEFDSNTTKKYPVVYLLHGFTDTYSAWVDKGHLDQVADEMIQKGEIPPMIIIMPNAGGPATRGTWNGYFNMEGWAYHDFFYQELMPTLEKKYRIIGDRANRAVSGLSMGGGHTFRISMQNAGTFGYMGLFSAAVRLEWNTKKSLEQQFNDNQEAAAQMKALFAAKPHLYWIAIGKDDFLFQQNVELRQYLDKMQYPYEYYESEGGHIWRNWRIYLSMFAQRLF